MLWASVRRDADADLHPMGRSLVRTDANTCFTAKGFRSFELIRVGVQSSDDFVNRLFNAIERRWSPRRPVPNVWLLVHWVAPWAGT